MQESKGVTGVVDGKDAALRPRQPAENAAFGRAQLVKSLYREIGLSLHDAASLVEAVLEEIATALIRGDTVKLSSFGTFGVKRKKPRVGRNPKTGKEAPIAARTVLVLRASHILKDRINNRPS
jgi:integration host factor subunit alpha